MDVNEPQLTQSSLNPDFYIHQDGEQAGPYKLADIVSQAKSRSIKPDAQYWQEGNDAWKPISELPEIKKSVKNMPEFMTQEESVILKQIRGIGTYWIIFPTLGLVGSFFTLILNGTGTSNNASSGNYITVVIVVFLAVFFASTIWAGVEIKALKKWAWWYLIIYSCLFFWAGFNWIACPYTLYWLIKGRKMF